MLSKHRLRRLLGFPVRWYYGDRTISVAGEAGVKLHFKPAESPRLLKGPQRLEAETRRQWAMLLKPGDSIIDCGAHIGITTQRFYGILQGKCQIWSIEPNPRTFALLEQNTCELKPQVQIFSFAVGDKQGEVTFSDNLKHGALSRMVHLRGGARETSGYWDESNDVTVPMQTLDWLIEEHSECQPSFLKIDVEGAGDLLMAGAKKLLAQYKPVCYAEYHTRKEIDAICGGLAELGYRGVRFDGSRRPHWADPESEPLYFVHPEHEAAKVVA